MAEVAKMVRAMRHQPSTGIVAGVEFHDGSTDVRFCDQGCWECFQSDIDMGLYYGPVFVPGKDGPVTASVAHASLICNRCAYCRSDLTPSN